MMLGVTSTDATCGGADGTATAAPIVATAPVTYSWSTGGTTDNLAGLLAGTYDVTATDANGCTGTGSTTIADSPPPTIAVTSNDVSCFGGADGSLTVSGTGGSAPYQYSIDGISFSGLGVFSGLTAGTYDAIIRGVDGCSDTMSVTITEPTELMPVTSATDDTCSSGLGSVMASPTGGTLPYTFIWTVDLLLRQLQDDCWNLFCYCIGWK